eukprot:COSAG05_NODE_581_length_8548_cov_3.360279_9_plen_361_part_00
MDDEHLPTTDYDVAVVGTGLIECIVAGAAARVGKTVVHLDPNDFYGGDWASFALKDFVGYIRSTPERPPPPQAIDSVDTGGKTRLDPVAVAPAPRFDCVEEWRVPAPVLLDECAAAGRDDDPLAPAAAAANGAVDDAPERQLRLPHHDPSWWAKVQRVWQEGAPIATLGELEEGLRALCPEANVEALRSMFVEYPETEATFLQSTLPHIIRRAMVLPVLVGASAPIPILQQGVPGMVELRRTVAASLLANMFLCNFPSQVEDAQMPPRSNFARLFAGAHESGVAKLRMFVHYFERLRAEAADALRSIGAAPANADAPDADADEILGRLPQGVVREDLAGCDEPPEEGPGGTGGAHRVELG